VNFCDDEGVATTSVIAVYWLRLFDKKLIGLQKLFVLLRVSRMPYLLIPLASLHQNTDIVIHQLFLQKRWCISLSTALHREREPLSLF
jgi:hypothetical protein